MHGLCAMLRLVRGQTLQSKAAILDERALASSCKGGPRAHCYGYKRKQGSKVHLAVDTLGHLLALLVTPAN